MFWFHPIDGDIFHLYFLYHDFTRKHDVPQFYTICDFLLICFQATMKNSFLQALFSQIVFSFIVPRETHVKTAWKKSFLPEFLERSSATRWGSNWRSRKNLWFPQNERFNFIFETYCNLQTIMAVWRQCGTSNALFHGGFLPQAVHRYGCMPAVTAWFRTLCGVAYATMWYQLTINN